MNWSFRVIRGQWSARKVEAPPGTSKRVRRSVLAVLLHARLLLWVDLQSSALQPGVNGDPGCSAALTLYLVHNATPAGQSGGCASAGSGLIPPGEHLLDFGTPLATMAFQPGDGILAQVAFGLSFPQGVAYVLGGGERASALSLTGLHEPLPA